MIPVINIPGLGALIAVGAILKTVGGYIFTACNWVKNQVVAVATGSRLWATAFFLTIAIFLIGVLTTVLSKVETYFLSAYMPSIFISTNDFSFEFSVVNQAIPLKKVFDLGFWIVNTTLAVYVVDHNIIFFRQLVEKFRILIGSWKT